MFQKLREHLSTSKRECLQYLIFNLNYSLNIIMAHYMSKLLNNLQLLKVKVSNEEVITVSRNRSVTFQCWFWSKMPYWWLVDGCYGYTIKHSSGFTKHLLLPICWLSIVSIECLMEHLAILQTHRQKSLVVREHHQCAWLPTFSGCGWILEYFYLFVVPLVFSYFVCLSADHPVFTFSP